MIDDAVTMPVDLSAALSCRLLEVQKQENGGVWPETVAVVLWGTDNIKTYGESLAQVHSHSQPRCLHVFLVHCWTLQAAQHVLVTNVCLNSDVDALPKVKLPCALPPP